MSNTIAPTDFYRTLNVEGQEIFYREAGPEMLPPFCSCTVFRRLLICSAIRFPCLRINITSLPQTSLDMAKAQHRRSTISTTPTSG